MSETETKERYDEAIELIAAILECGTNDAEIILDMMRHHNGNDELIDRVRAYMAATGDGWTFSTFVTGVEGVVRDALQPHTGDELQTALQSIVIDANYSAWGSVASHNNDIELDTARIFAEMCRDGVSDEQIEELIESYKET